METENQVTDASGGTPDPAPAATPTSSTTPAPEPTPTPVATTAKVEVQDGRVMVDGKKFVAESDLIASKKSLETKLSTQQTAHDTAIDAAKLAESAAQQAIASLTAKAKEMEDAPKTSAVTDEAAASAKQELEAARDSIVAFTAEAGVALELKRANLVLQYGIVPDTIKDKNMTELGSFEEALKAVSTAKGGVGNYALGGGSTDAAPQTDIERAAKVIEATPIRGVREPAPAT